VKGSITTVVGIGGGALWEILGSLRVSEEDYGPQTLSLSICSLAHDVRGVALPDAPTMTCCLTTGPKQ
jgi:hypothetical protein